MVVYVGVDVSKDGLDVAVRPSDEAPVRLGNDVAGVGELTRRMKVLKPTLIVMESTSRYHQEAAIALAAQGLPVAVVNPRQVRDFAKSTGKLAKTDALDAAVIAHFAEAVKPEVRPLPDEQARELIDLVHRRQHLIEMRQQEKNRLPMAHAKIRHGIVKHISWLTKALDDTDDKLKKLIRSSPVWREKDDLLQSVMGVGPQLSASVLARLPELGAVSNKVIAALVGIAPFNRDSGNWKGQRSVKGGRSDVRKILYMATVVAIRHNPELKAFYTRLRDAGKPAKQAIVATMRKLLCCLNAMMRDKASWNPQRVLPRPTLASSTPALAA